MIRYIELTPESNIAFQSGKILRTLIHEGDTIEAGDTLFLVDAQGKEVEILASKAGKVTELIVFPNDIIHKLSSLLVLETNVANTSTENTVATPAETTSNSAPQKNAKKRKADQKQPSVKELKGDNDKQSSIDFELMSNDSSNESSEIQENNTTMSEIKVPDLGGADAVEVIDILSLIHI